MPKLAVTMQKVADDPDSYYNGELAKNIAEDLKDAGSHAFTFKISEKE